MTDTTGNATGRRSLKEQMEADNARVSDRVEDRRSPSILGTLEDIITNQRYLADQRDKVAVAARHIVEGWHIYRTQGHDAYVAWERALTQEQTAALSAAMNFEVRDTEMERKARNFLATSDSLDRHRMTQAGVVAAADLADALERHERRRLEAQGPPQALQQPDPADNWRTGTVVRKERQKQLIERKNKARVEGDTEGKRRAAEQLRAISGGPTDAPAPAVGRDGEPAAMGQPTGIPKRKVVVSVKTYWRRNADGRRIRVRPHQRRNPLPMP